MTVLLGTTREHTRGTGVDVFLDEGSARATTPFLQSKDWEYPTVLEAPTPETGGSTSASAGRSELLEKGHEGLRHEPMPPDVGAPRGERGLTFAGKRARMAACNRSRPPCSRGRAP